MSRLHLTYAEEGQPVPARQVRGENNQGREEGGQSTSFVRAL